MLKKHKMAKGDTMQLLNLKSKSELNGKLVDILGEDIKAEGCWMTKLVADLNPEQSDGTMSIATEKRIATEKSTQFWPWPSKPRHLTSVTIVTHLLTAASIRLTML